jgi:hypothetical protein
MDTVENDAVRETFVSKGYANNAEFPGRSWRALH